MTPGWITPPHELFLAKSAPYLAPKSNRAQLREEFEKQGARVWDVDIGPTRSLLEFFAEFRRVVRLPEWCAYGWDSLYDAFEELRANNEFPMALLIVGLRDLLDSSTHLGLEVVLRLEELTTALSTRGDQMVVIYLGDLWS